ncbi:MAG: GAF domain-containing protein [Acidobacteriota bacterium]
MNESRGSGKKVAGGRSSKGAARKRTDWKSAYEALKAECGRLVAIADVTEDGLFVFSSSHEIEYVNPTITRLFGPVEGRKCHEYLNGRSGECPGCKLREVLSGRSVRSTWSCARTGRKYDVFEAPLENADGSVSKLGILHDITDHKRVEETLRLDEARFEALLTLSRMAECSPDTMVDFVIEQGVKLTRSGMGFLGILSEDGSMLTMKACSRGSDGAETIPDEGLRLPLERAGVWANSIRLREPFVMNDYSGPDPFKVGLPEGHPSISRMMSIPVFDGERIVAIAVMANKGEEYDASDVRQIRLLTEGLWSQLRHKETERALRRSQWQLKSLSSKLLTVQEEERTRLAQELHDTIGQNLVAIKFAVENALCMKGKNRSRLMAGQLEGLIPTIQNTIEEARRIYMDLRPTVLDDFGIIAAIGWLCGQIRKLYPSLVVDNKVRLVEADVPKVLKTPIFRIMQEAMLNAAKHSRAGAVSLCLLKAGGGIELTVSDNGSGFDPETVLAIEGLCRGLGLSSMQELAELSGGSFQLDSREGHGTTVRAFWPLLVGE